jgi:hypothetical protein
VPQQRPGISATPTTIRSRLSDLVAGLARPIATDERHAARIGNRAASALDWLPGVGDAMGVQEGVQQAGRGGLANLVLGSGSALLSVIPGAPPSRKLIGNDNWDIAMPFARKAANARANPSPSLVHEEVRMPSYNGDGKTVPAIRVFDRNTGETLSVARATPFEKKQSRIERAYENAIKMR